MDDLKLRLWCVSWKSPGGHLHDVLAIGSTDNVASLCARLDTAVLVQPASVVAERVGSDDLVIAVTELIGERLSCTQRSSQESASLPHASGS